MKYERLTTKCEVGIGLTETSENIVNDYEKVVTRLAELEDKIEDEALVDLPCKVGDRVEGNGISGEVCKIVIENRGIYITVYDKEKDKFSNYLVCSAEDADAKLKVER